MQTQIDSQTKKRFRTIGHKLSPVVMIASNGLTPNILEDIDLRLEKNELIKIKIAVEDRSAKKVLVEEVCNTLHATLVQQIGSIALIYRSADNVDPKLSNIVRHPV